MFGEWSLHDLPDDERVFFFKLLDLISNMATMVKFGQIFICFGSN